MLADEHQLQCQNGDDEQCARPTVHREHCGKWIECGGVQYTAEDVSTFFLRKH